MLGRSAFLFRERNVFCGFWNRGRLRWSRRLRERMQLLRDGG